jgi:GT2 family glycosyltransferase/glycosyltransferase involved in cell wall biosynthesis
VSPEARARLRTALGARLAVGTPLGDTARTALDVYREVRRVPSDLRGRARERSGRVPRPDADTWRHSQRPSGPELEHLHHVAITTANRTAVHFVVEDGPGADATRRSLAAGLWPHTTQHTVPRGGIARAIAQLPDQDLVVVLAPGDTVERDLAFRVADAVWSNPSLYVVTWEDDLRGAADDRRFRFRPVTWSPELLLSANVAGRALAVRVDRLRSAGDWNESAPDPWWDLLARLDPAPERVKHLPEVLAEVGDRHDVSPSSMAPAISDMLARRGWPATAVAGPHGIRLDWEPEQWPRVTVVVPTRHNRPLLTNLLATLRATDYPDWELQIVDNGGRTEERDGWYSEQLDGIDAQVNWWEEPFNYGTVNNHGVGAGDGEVVVLLNDDTEVEPGWLRELAGWAMRPEIGTVGVQLVDGRGLIQHGGVVVGMSGMADHLFAGLAPHSTTLFGSTDWYRNASANTAACVALRRELWDRIGGLDERFALLGSDVVLGLDATAAGHRNVTTPAIHVRHLESVTRGTDVPVHDMFSSYWRYDRLLRVGDPYFTPCLSLESPELRLRSGAEPTPLERVGPTLGRSFGVFRQSASVDEASMLADMCRLQEERIEAYAQRRAGVVGARDVRTVNWFLPDIENPFYGGIATALRIADHLRIHHGVENRFIVWSSPNEAWFRSAIDASFPGLSGSPIHFHDGSLGPRLDDLPSCDVAVATQWPTAYVVAAFERAERGFYLVQDFEPMFHPAGTMYALAEESYRLGLYGLCNTVSMGRFYAEDYGGSATHFVPAVDDRVFHARTRPERDPDDPVTVFLYARPGHWRNCWEMVSLALDELKATYGSRLRIVTAGSWARPDDIGRGIDHLGLLDYRSTGELYRSADIGISLTVSPHPSYLPLELMACGAAVVAFDLPPGYWILHGEQNCLLARRTVPGLVEQVSRLVDDPELRDRIQDAGVATIAKHHGDWDAALSRVYHAMCDPERFARRDLELIAADPGGVSGPPLLGLGPVPAPPA